MAPFSVFSSSHKPRLAGLCYALTCLFLFFLASQSCSPGTGQQQEQSAEPVGQQQQDTTVQRDGSSQEAEPTQPDLRDGPGQDATRDKAPKDQNQPEKASTSEAPASPDKAPIVERRPPPERPRVCPPPQGDPPQRKQGWRTLSLNATKAVTATLPACDFHLYRVVAAKGMTLVVEIQGVDKYAKLDVTAYNARRGYGIAPDAYLARGTTYNKGWLSLKAIADQSGETIILVDARRHNKTINYEISAYCDGKCQLEATRYPIVLMHGFFGTDKYFGLLDYYYQVKGDLTKRGYNVFTPKVQPIANSTTRVKALKKAIDDILRQTGARKLNLIAHSQGGVDGRLLISKHKYGAKVASLTTISTPHRGVPLPNLLIPPSQELGEKNMAQYNKSYPNDPQVRYFSWAGASCAPLERSCRQKRKGEVVDTLLIATYRTLQGLRGANDGIVPVSSAKWGTYLGEINADHFDQIGQIADRNNKPFRHKDFYLSEARRLKKLDF